MPNKTIYVKDADLPLFERAQDQLGESVSWLFAEFLRDRVAQLTPEQQRIVEFITRIENRREAAKSDSAIPEFIQGEFGAAAEYAGKALHSLRAGEAKNAKIFWYAANKYFDWAERDLKETRELNDKLAQMLAA